MMVAETAFIAMATALAGFLLIYSLNDCTTAEPYDEHHATIAKVRFSFLMRVSFGNTMTS